MLTHHTIHITLCTHISIHTGRIITYITGTLICTHLTEGHCLLQEVKAHGSSQLPFLHGINSYRLLLSASLIKTALCSHSAWLSSPLPGSVARVHGDSSLAGCSQQLTKGNDCCWRYKHCDSALMGSSPWGLHETSSVMGEARSTLGCACWALMSTNMSCLAQMFGNVSSLQPTVHEYNPSVWHIFVQFVTYQCRELALSVEFLCYGEHMINSVMIKINNWGEWWVFLW